jgi:Asp-tRNA(Asn)/Glu-tRNA(Gln) amidotransferase A subunit family amidase
MSVLSEFERYDALALADLVRRKDVTAGEILEETIARIEVRNPIVNAVVNKMYDEARKVVAAGLPDGPFTGVPYLLKDLGAQYTGVVTAGGSRLFAKDVADHDSELTIRLRRAGLVVVGKSSTPEMGLAPSTEPRLFGPTKNPWKLTHSAGGSSGGAAAAVAAGILPMAHATDGGGSIRIPASCCGLFGVKPTRGRVSMAPDAGEGWGGASVAHAVTRTVRDSAALLDATAGPAQGDPYWAPPPPRPYLEEVGREPGKLRIALNLTPWFPAEVDRECADAVRDAAKLCASLGHEVEEARPEIDVAKWRQANRMIVAANVAATLDARAALMGRPLAEDDVERMVWDRVKDARAFSASDYAMATRIVHLVGRQVARFMERYDIILTPTMAAPPWPLGVLDMMTTDVDGYLKAVFASIGFTSLFNSTGQPAMSVPLAWSSSGLPLGVQFVSRFGDEGMLFRLGAQLESARPWIGRRPQVVARA